MADDQHIRVHRVQGHRRVDQGLALVHRAGGDRHVDHVAAEPLAGDLERGAGPGRALEEAVDDRPAAQRCPLLLDLAIQFDIPVRQIEEMVYFLGRQTLDPEQMTMPEGGIAGSTLHKPWTIGRALPTGKSGTLAAISVCCRPGEGRDPLPPWIPSFAGITSRS